MHNKLIKYLEENFNAKIIHKRKLSVLMQSDLHLVDFPTVVEDFKGELKINEDGDTLVDNNGKESLFMMVDSSPFTSASLSSVKIYKRIDYAKKINYTPLDLLK